MQEVQNWRQKGLACKIGVWMIASWTAKHTSSFFKPCKIMNSNVLFVLQHVGPSRRASQDTVSTVIGAPSPPSSAAGGWEVAVSAWKKGQWIRVSLTSLTWLTSLIHWSPVKQKSSLKNVTLARLEGSVESVTFGHRLAEGAGCVGAARRWKMCFFWQWPEAQVPRRSLEPGGSRRIRRCDPLGTWSVRMKRWYRRYCIYIYSSIYISSYMYI